MKVVCFFVIHIPITETGTKHVAWASGPEAMQEPTQRLLIEKVRTSNPA
jgi:hypothetical protein